MTVPNHPQSVADYRDRTKQHEESSLNSVRFHNSFKCPVCKRIMPRLGRQARGGKLGFRCFECKEKRDARIKLKSVANNTEAE